jgi:hypothetical protein
MAFHIKLAEALQEEAFSSQPSALSRELANHLQRLLAEC